MNSCTWCDSKTNPLRKSHIIPKFVYSWLKKTSATGRMRYSLDINRPAQDGVKQKFLCSECEEEFSAKETYFQKNLFNKIANYSIKKIPTIENAEPIKQFCVMQSWRALAYSFYISKIDQFHAEELSKIPCFLDALQQTYYNINLAKSYNFEFHIVPLCSELSALNVINDSMHVYYQRVIGFEPMIWDNYYRLTVFVKMPFILLVCLLIKSEDEHWCGTNVMTQKSLFNIDKIEIPTYLMNYMEKSHAQAGELSQKISLSQREKIIKIAKNKNTNCGTFIAIKKDKD